MKQNRNRNGRSRKPKPRKPRVRIAKHERVFPTYPERILSDLAFEFELLGHQLKRGDQFDKNDCRTLNNRKFQEAFGCGSKVCAITWLLIVNGWLDRPTGATKMQFLWSLMFLKEYETENNMAAEFGCNEKIFRYWVWFFLKELSYLVGEVVSFFLSFVFVNVTYSNTNHTSLILILFFTSS